VWSTGYLSDDAVGGKQILTHGDQLLSSADLSRGYPEYETPSPDSTTNEKEC
jgi:hypothetical protein